MRNVVLSQEELNKLNNGEEVEAKGNNMQDKTKIFPPCETNGHDWYGYQINSDSMITRRCRACNTTDKIGIDSFDALFDYLKRIEAGEIDFTNSRLAEEIGVDDDGL